MTQRVIVDAGRAEDEIDQREEGSGRGAAEQQGAGQCILSGEGDP